MQEIILFFMTFLLMFFIYQLFVVRKSKKNFDEKRPTEINYLIYKYNIKIDKSNYKTILNLVALTSAFDVSLVVTVVALFEQFVLQVICIAVLSPAIFFISYHILGKSLKKEGRK